MIQTRGKKTSQPNLAEAAEGTGTVHRAVRLIAALAATRGEVGVGDLAGRVGLPLPTIHRLLHLLRKEGVVSWSEETHRYAIGPELYRIAAQVRDSVDIGDLAQRELEILCDQVHQTALFGLYQPGTLSMSFAAKAEADHPLQYRIQMHVPLSLVWGASGKAILAYLSEDQMDRALASETANSASGAKLPERERLLQDLARVRKTGFAVSEGEKLYGARGIAAPVFNSSGIAGSICLTSPQDRIAIDRIAELAKMVVQAAARLSRSFGARMDNVLG
ncbi:hypothetical protein IP81_16270 [Novosphingobium sp. AAP83]|nr:hypothetical protein IP81_16270 [Novosphingobium sp. AAP83]